MPLAKMDGRGLPVLAPQDGSQTTESFWAVGQDGLSANSFSKTTGHGLLMCAADKYSIKALSLARRY